FFRSVVAQGESFVPTTGTQFLLYALILVASMPIGAAFTALHFVCLKMVRDEEGYITKDFFRSFKLNFKQATVIWTVAMLIGALLIFNFSYIRLMDSQTIFFATSAAAAIFLYITLLYVFPILSHFENTIKGTVKNAFFMSILALPKTVVMVIVTLVPVAIIYFIERFEAMFWLMPITYLFWFSLPAYVCAKLYDKTFKRFEPEAAKTDDFSWSVNASEDGEVEETAEVAEIAEVTDGAMESESSAEEDKKED
ncbi:MAG: DUF624 domain-containing protein, partial [Lachnospiraceae bacterium]|nr:DUF624 domain-containing protein [Lachnospiraceae bacterium]